MKNFSKTSLLLLTQIVISNVCLGASHSRPMTTIQINFENLESALHELFRNPFEIQTKTDIKEIIYQNYCSTNRNKRLDTQPRNRSEFAVATFNVFKSKLKLISGQANTENLHIVFLVKCHAIVLLLWSILTSRALSTLVRDQIPRLFDVQQ